MGCQCGKGVRQTKADDGGIVSWRSPVSWKQLHHVTVLHTLLKLILSCHTFCCLLQINAGIVKGLVEACGRACPGVSGALSAMLADYLQPAAVMCSQHCSQEHSRQQCRLQHGRVLAACVTTRLPGAYSSAPTLQSAVWAELQCRLACCQPG